LRIANTPEPLMNQHRLTWTNRLGALSIAVTIGVEHMGGDTEPAGR